MKLVAALLTVYVVWGSTFLAIAVADRTLPPFLMLAGRFLLAGAVLYWWARRRGAERPTARQWGAAAAVGAALLVLDTGGVAWAEQRLASGVTALLVASVALFIVLLDRVCFGVRIAGNTALGIAVGLGGVGLLVGSGGHVDPLGAAVVLGASFAWAAGSAYARVAPLPKDTLLSAAMQMVTAGVGLTAASAVAGERVTRLPSAVSLSAFAFLVVFGSLLAFTAYGWLLRNAPTPLVSTYAYVNPAVAVFLGWLLVGEHVGVRELLAGLVILCSVALLAIRHERRAAPEPVAEALQPYIRRQEARRTDFRGAPRLHELPRLAA
ncbi:MAG TPA: EamA family transporter [Gaiellaceae bacterium]|nr:EamA family transporter [Gaiellaceae bacterium]